MSEERIETTGACKFCGQMGQVRASKDWLQEDIDEEVTLMCQCEAAQKYAKAKERKDKAKKRIKELFGTGAEKPVADGVVQMLLASVDAIEDKCIKSITVSIGHGVKARVSKMASESIKVERSENKTVSFEE